MDKTHIVIQPLILHQLSKEVNWSQTQNPLCRFTPASSSVKRGEKVEKCLSVEDNLTTLGIFEAILQSESLGERCMVEGEVSGLERYKTLSF